MRKILMFLFVSLFILVLSGCATRIANFTIASTKNIDINSSYIVDTSKQVKGEDVIHVYCIVSTGTPDMIEAMNDAMAKAPGSVGLSNVSVKFGTYYIPLIYGAQWYEIEGNPVYENNK